MSYVAVREVHALMFVNDVKSYLQRIYVSNLRYEYLKSAKYSQNIFWSNFISIMTDPVVCDVGSATFKVGFASERFPSHVIPSVIGKLRDGRCHNYGHDALKERNKVTLSYPVQGGIIQNWEDAGGLLSHAIGTLSNDMNKDSKLLVTEPAFNPVKNKKKMLEILIESMAFDNVKIANQSILVLYAHGLLSGMVVDCGEGTTQIVPVYEGFAPEHLVKRHPITGSLITKYLSSLLQIGSNSKFAYDMVTVKEIKEKLCYAAQDLKQDRRLVRETTVLNDNYVLPDGTAVRVGREKFECTEAYFDPSLVDIECAGLSDFIFDTIQECDVSMRRNMYEHIILS